MQMQGQRSIKASRAEVWKALNDPEVLKASIPGCEELEQTSDNKFEGKVKQKIGPVNARFTVIVELSDIVEAQSYRISGEGKGGAAGFAKGGAAVRLEDEGDGTLLSYDAEAKVGGKLAQLGSRLIDGYARKMSDEFFDRFKERVEPPGAASEAEPEAESQASGQTQAQNASEQAGAEKTAGTASGKKAAAGGNPAAAGGPQAAETGSLWDRIRAWFRRLIG